MLQGGNCRYRHLSPNHPDAIADRFKSHLLSEEEIIKYGLRPCEEYETNPFAPKDAPKNTRNESLSVSSFAARASGSY